MKYVLVFTLIAVGLWLWRNSRRPDSPPARKNSASQATRQQRLPTEIVACKVCQVHLPLTEALTGPGGVYCSAAHRQQGEG